MNMKSKKWGRAARGYYQWNGQVGACGWRLEPQLIQRRVHKVPVASCETNGI